MKNNPLSPGAPLKTAGKNQAPRSKNPVDSDSIGPPHPEKPG